MKIVIFTLLLSALFTDIFDSCVVAEDRKRQRQSKRTYIVHMDKSSLPKSFNDHFNWYDSSLKSVSDSARMFYTYNHAIHGFSTRLTKKEAELLEKQPGVLSVLQEMRYELHTTRTPEFLGLGKSKALFPSSDRLSDVIIGVLDSGVWPESKSFDDAGLEFVPTRWNGVCEEMKNFNASSCNRKLIGARSFARGYQQALGLTNNKVELMSPRDYEGHGTHTSTIAAGSAVVNASLFGFASGTARGMAPAARVAMYKVCWIDGCFGSDILAAIDCAIADGVDVLSMSIGGSTADYYKDVIAIGAFQATVRGITVSVSAGNDGPVARSLSNVAPWIITVGAGTLDRDFPAHVILGNGEKYKGVSLYSGTPLPDELVPIVYASTASDSSSGNLCLPDSLVPEKVAGKIVVCNEGGIPKAKKGEVVKDAGGVGMILTNTETYGEELEAEAHVLPTATVDKRIGDLIKIYVSSDANKKGTVTQGSTQLGVQPSPTVVAFSSRGPNPITPEILKPDVIAPGVNILAGWTGRVAPSGLSRDKRRVNFNIVSGTSMSCPHVSGLAALLKATQPEWSPAAIKSALMTTSYLRYKDGKSIYDVATGNPATPFDYGAGHVDAVAAFDPGLVYDATPDDYVSFLCALSYSKNEIQVITGSKYGCDATKKYSVLDFNYPSFAVPLESTSSVKGGTDVPSTVKYTRILTNVGPPGTYKVSVSSDTPSVKVLVKPKSLTFTRAQQTKTYTVTFTAHSQPSGTTSFGRLEWSDGQHIVGSPIAFSWE